MGSECVLDSTDIVDLLIVELVEVLHLVPRASLQEDGFERPIGVAAGTMGSWVRASVRDYAYWVKAVIITWSQRNMVTEEMVEGMVDKK